MLRRTISRLLPAWGSMGAMGGSGGQLGLLPEVQLDGLGQPDGDRAEQLQPRAAQRHAIGFQRQVRPVAVESRPAGTATS